MLLTRPLPRTVEVCGVAVPVNWGFRSGVEADMVGAADPGAAARFLEIYLGRDGMVPSVAALNPSEALEAAAEFHRKGLSFVAYGRGRGAGRKAPGAPNRGIDWERDAGIVVADFRRLYGVDLTDEGADMHWWAFGTLLLCAARTEGSLVGEALGARNSRLPAKGEARKAAEARRRAWELPMTAAQARARAAEEFARR